MAWNAAWTREAFLRLVPVYDNKDEIAFVDEEASLWEDTFNGGEIVYPGLFHDKGRTGARSMNSDSVGWRRGKRFFLVKSAAVIS